MADMIKNIIMSIISIYAIIISIVYWIEYNNKENYQKERELSLKKKEEELKNRESIVVDKEICFRELTKLNTIHSSVLDILKSGSIPNAPNLPVLNVPYVEEENKTQ